ncbi:MAG: F0F1 ATP synthase subunit epsilon [Balneolaceae bacterium]|nr:F0F1 ATP synthase subunit epsilon [Balneolaceae bacterium]
MNTLEAQILTPEGTLFDDDVVGVKVPGTLGNFEVKPMHASIISSLEIGQILVRLASGGEAIFAVSGGFVEVHNNKLTLLAEAAEPADEIDVDRARDAKKRAQERLSSEDKKIDKERAKQALKRAENRIRVADKALA